ncbi:hypothetical protein HK099_007639 [Clydaea vesicula]|uniref:Uncharacterized protein n=1 Tax=Clydaea vesicula TaxID=447962 RepID=A0AAD5U5F4_9FUNG|nr:hypothetical protein HK099_007639 [Clydaea vesicula]
MKGSRDSNETDSVNSLTSKVRMKVEIEITNVEPILLHADLNNSASKNEYEINIFSKQSYFPISRWPIVLNAKTTLHLVYENNSWVVVKHKDVWLDYTRIDLAPELIKAAWGSLTSVVINTWYGLKT